MIWFMTPVKGSAFSLEVSAAGHPIAGVITSGKAAAVDSWGLKGSLFLQTCTLEVSAHGAPTGSITTTGSRIGADSWRVQP